MKNAEYTVRWFTERKADIECKRARFRFDGSKRRFADISEIMQSDVFQTGCDGETEWSLSKRRGTNYQTRKLEDIREIHLSFLDPLRLLDVDDDKLEQTLENRKIRYFGTETRDGKEYHLFGNFSVREDKFVKTTTWTEIAVDAETGLPGPVRTLHETEMDFNEQKQNIVSLSTLLFDIEKQNAEFSDADFLPENVKELQAVAKEKPDGGYDTFYVVIDDGSTGRMSVRCNGQKGSKGAASSGLN